MTRVSCSRHACWSSVLIFATAVSCWQCSHWRAAYSVICAEKIICVCQVDSSTTDRLQPGEDNVPLGRLAHWTTQEIVEMGWEVLTHLIYSLDLAPIDFHLFAPLIWKNHLAVEFNWKTRMQYSNLDFKITMLQALHNLLSNGNIELHLHTHTHTHRQLHTHTHTAELTRSLSGRSGPWLVSYSKRLEMGRSSADTEVRPKNSAECSARQHETIRPNFGKHSASLWLQIGGVLRSPLALTKVNTPVSYTHLTLPTILRV